MIAYMFQKSWKFLIPIIYNFCIYWPLKFAIFLKSSLLFNSFYCLFLLVNKTLLLNKLKTRADMNAKISVFVICVETIIYLLLNNLHDWPLSLTIEYEWHPKHFAKARYIHQKRLLSFSFVLRTFFNIPSQYSFLCLVIRYQS